MPKKVTLLRQMFGNQAQNSHPNLRFGYEGLLRTAFYNMDEEARNTMSANFIQIDEYVEDYLVFKGQKAAFGEKKPAVHMNYFHDLLVSTTEILSFKVEAAHLQRVIMCWN